MSASPAPSGPIIRKPVEFYTIALAQLANGEMSVSITATTVDDEEPQFLDQEIVSKRVPSLHHALALIKTGITSSLGL